MTSLAAPPASFREDTIAAIATATGPAGVGIVRISGPEAFTIAERITRSASGKLSQAAKQAGHTLRRAVVRDPVSGDTIDDALVAVFHAPRSFTGENVVEIQGHGGTVTLSRVLAAALSAGARVARPGEFSERAFLNRKMDLAQAEAVADLVSAQTVMAQKAARRQLSGRLSGAVRECADFLMAALALLEASIDFPEDVGEIDPVAVDTHFADADAAIRRLLQTSAYGRRLSEGITVALAGRPNVGKSSLLNALAGAERAIVTPIPGTTRDVVEEALQMGGLPVRALDTAGIRDTEDPVERIGVERARQAVRDADVVIAVLDAQDGITDADRRFLCELAAENRSFVVAVNKADAADPSPAVREARAWTHDAVAIVPLSAVTGDGLHALADAVAQAVTGFESGGVPREDTTIVTSARHTAALETAQHAVRAARDAVADNLPAELIAVDGHAALSALGEITGETAREEIIAGIFSRFCIGK